jgi:hypothetical protein
MAEFKSNYGPKYVLSLCRSRKTERRIHTIIRANSSLEISKMADLYLEMVTLANALK